MKKSQSIVSVVLASVALFAIALVSSPVQAQRSGNRPDMNRGQGQHQDRDRGNTPAVKPAPRPADTAHSGRTTHNAHDNHGHSRYHDRDYHSSHRSRHGGYINVNFGRRVPHTTTQRVWVPGHYVTTTERVLVSEGHYDTKVIPARYEWRRHHGHYDRVCVEPERVVKVWHPAEYENRTVQTWVPGCYKTVTDTHYHRTRPSISIGGIFRI